MYLRDIPALQDDIHALITNDPIITQYHITADHLQWHAFESGFEGLVRVVQSQQISAKVADTLWLKLKSTTNGTLTPDYILSLSAEELKPYGMTQQKTIYIKGLAQKIIDGAFQPKDLKTMNDDDATKAIIDLKGFGLWSAQIYLMFCEQRRNILPANDLVLDRAVQSLFSLPKRPDYKTLLHHAKPWDGKYTAASLICWALYTNGIIPRPE